MWWRRRLVAAVRRHAPRDVLDLATGSGDVAFALSRGLPPPVQIAGMDFCAPMLVEAEAKKAAAEGGRRYGNVRFSQADALALPLPDASFDAVTISFGLRNVVDTETALAEMLRVTRPGGRLVVCEFSTPSWAPFRTVYSGYLMRALPSMAREVARQSDSYVYLAESIRDWPDQQALGRVIKAAGWGDVAYRNLSGGIVALHRGVRPA